MPELPEVETIRSSLQAQIMGLQIVDVVVHRPKTIDNVSVEVFTQQLKGKTLKKINRKAKHLIFEFETLDILMTHLKMSGAYLVRQPSDALEKHVHVVFYLSDGLELRFKDLRAFGRMLYFSSMDEAQSATKISQLAPEPLSSQFTYEHFASRLNKYSTTIKPLLLDQERVVCGLGNIYVDESLFCAGVHPLSKANELTDVQSEKLYESIKRIISEAIKQGGTTFRDYVDSSGKKGQYAENLYVYGRKKQLCKVCETPIIYQKVAQRGTHFCPQCQPLK